jgi:DNA-3-methyladenine glycosylase II
MRDVIRRAGPFTLRLNQDRFRSLVFSILSQQISGKAAASMGKRLVEYLRPDKITAESLNRLAPEVLRTVGISNQKAAYMLDLANKVSSGEIRLDQMGRLPDEKVIEHLIQVKGIGVWTAQMFLIFSLGRLDVFPHDDLGVRAAIRNLYGLAELPEKSISFRIAERWRPYATVASWYCWRSLEFGKD